MTLKVWLYLLAAAVVVSDQITKALATARLDYGEPVVVTAFFNLTLLHNTGAAFSFLGDADGWQRWLFVGLAIGVSVVLAVWLRAAVRARAPLFVGLALILGGAIGNLIDRLRLGYVVDFIQVHYAGWYFPAFNVADSAITVGAGLVILDAFRPEPKP